MKRGYQSFVNTAGIFSDVMELESGLSGSVSERLIELVRRVGNSDYGGVDLGGVDVNSLEPELLIRELAWHLFPVEGTAQQVKFRRSRNEEENQYADVFETGINVFAQANYDEQWRFDHYGLFFGLGTFDSRRKNEKSSLWKPEIRGEIKLLNGDFDSLTVTAQYDGNGTDSTDYMEFIEALGGRVTKLCVCNKAASEASFFSDLFPNRFVADVSFLEYEVFHKQRSVPYTKKNVGAYVESELNRLIKIGQIDSEFKPGFKEGRVRSVAFFQTENPDDSGVFCLRSTAPHAIANDSYRPLAVPRGNVAYLRLTELTDENFGIAKRFLQTYCFVKAE